MIRQVSCDHSNTVSDSNTDYKHEKEVCKDFKISNLGEYHGLYIQCDTLLLVDVFNTFQYLCLKIYELDQARVFSASD